MKKIILSLIAAGATFTAIAQSPTPSPTPLVMIPAATTITVINPITLTLSPAQVSALATAIASQGITLPTGMTGFNFRLLTTGNNAGGATVRILFQ